MRIVYSAACTKPVLGKMDKVVLDDKNVVFDDSDVFVASKTCEEVIVISESESVESAPVSPVKKKVK